MHKSFGLVLVAITLSTLSIAQGNVGIGTSTPEARLHIRSTGWIKTIFENDAGQPRGYIGTDNNGTVTLAANAFWNGSAWVYPNSGSSMYLLMHRVNNRFEFRVRPEGGSEQTPMVINTAGRVGIGTTTPQQGLSVGGGMVIDQNNLNTGTSANMLSFGGASGEGIGSKRAAGTGQFGLDFYTANIHRMAIANNGNVGIGTNNPQSLLDLAVGNNRNFRFKNDLVPTLEITSSTANDAFAGTMRLRNAIEIWPNNTATQAGRLDIRNTAGMPTIQLNGSTGIMEATIFKGSSIDVTSVIASGGVAAQSIYAPNLPAFAIKNCEVRVVVRSNHEPPLDAVLCDMTVDIPAPGFLHLQGSTSAWFDRWVGFDGAFPSGQMEMKLDEYTPGGQYVATVVKREFSNRVYVDPIIETIQAIPAAMQKRYKLILYKNGEGPGSAIISQHLLRAWFYPNLLQVN